jgi:hypothetical protein
MAERDVAAEFTLSVKLQLWRFLSVFVTFARPPSHIHVARVRYSHHIEKDKKIKATFLRL